MMFELSTVGFLASFARVGAWSVAAPFIGERVIPSRVRVIFAASVGMVLASVRGDVPYSALLAILPLEIYFGLLAGAASRLVIAGVEAGGQLIGFQLGLGFAGTFDPLSGEQSLPTRRLAMAIGGFAFVNAGGINEAIRALAVGDAAAVGRASLATLIEESSQVMVAAVRLAAPLLLAGFITNLALALASKAAPSLNVFSVMLAMFLTIGFMIMVSTAPTFASDMILFGQAARDAVWKVVAR